MGIVVLSSVLTACGAGVTRLASRAYPGASDLDRYTLGLLNGYRASAGVSPLTLDEKYSQFAFIGSEALSANGLPHQHFIDSINSAQSSPDLCGLSAENQAPGWPGSDPKAVVASMLQAMMDEGPGGGHHDNILGASYTLVGVSTIEKEGAYYLTNDFGSACTPTP